jgi:hypothetical protein
METPGAAARGPAAQRPRRHEPFLRGGARQARGDRRAPAQRVRRGRGAGHRESVPPLQPQPRAPCAQGARDQAGGTAPAGRSLRAGHAPDHGADAGLRGGVCAWTARRASSSLRATPAHRRRRRRTHSRHMLAAVPACLPACCLPQRACHAWTPFRRFLLGRRSTRPSHIVGGGRSCLCARRAPRASCGGRRCASRPAASSREMDRRVALQVRCSAGARRRRVG